MDNTEAIRILHLSDLHFATEREWDADPVLASLADSIGKLVENGLGPDIVAITGDIASTGRTEEYDLASQWIEKKLRKALPKRFPRRKLLFAPGNHDVDRNAVNLVAARALRSALVTAESQPAIAEILSDTDQRSLLLKPHAEYLQFANSFRSASDQLNVPWWSTTLTIRGHKIHLTGLCSSWLSFSDSEKGNLLVSRWQVNNLMKRAEGAEFSVVLVHHPWSYLADFDARAVQQTIQRESDIVLRGHLHEASAYSIMYPDNDLLELTAGACYSSSDHPNAFQLLEIHPSTRRVRLFRSLWKDGEWILDRNSYRTAPDGATVFYMRQAASSTQEGPGASLSVQDRISNGRTMRVLQLNRPEVRNALSEDLLMRIKKSILEAPTESTVLMSGEGKAFCGGLDVTEMKNLRSAAKHLTLLVELFEAMNHRAPIATIIRRSAFAGGAGIALFAHAVVAHENAKFVLPGQKEYRPLARVVIPAILGRRSADKSLFAPLFDKSCDETDLPDNAFSAQRAKDLFAPLFDKSCDETDLPDNAFSARQAKDCGLVDLVTEDDSLELMISEALALLERNYFLTEAWKLLFDATTKEVTAGLRRCWGLE